MLLAVCNETMRATPIFLGAPLTARWCSVAVLFQRCRVTLAVFLEREVGAFPIVQCGIFRMHGSLTMKRNLLIRSASDPRTENGAWLSE